MAETLGLEWHMVFAITVGALTREFAVWFPIGYEYWAKQLPGETGFPLLVASHGGGQSALSFIKNWDFTAVQNKDNVVSNKFILLVPLGFAVNYSATGEPLRYWRAWNQLVPNPDQDDSLFLRLAIDKVSTLVQTMYDAAGIVGRGTIDSNRRYLFGYSNGGMMSYRYANSTEFAQQYWAALWVMSGSIGGRRYTGANDVVNNPRPPTLVPSGISLFAHHGTKADTTSKATSEFAVPPGPTNLPTTLVRSEQMYDDLTGVGAGKGNVPTNQGDSISVYYRPLRGAIKEYLTRNNAAFGTFPTTDQSPSQTQNNQPDITGGTGSTRLTWRRTGTTNPEVVEYRDPTLGHTTYWDTTSVQYFTAQTVWDFMVSHPRTTV